MVKSQGRNSVAALPRINVFLVGGNCSATVSDCHPERLTKTDKLDLPRFDGQVSVLVFGYFLHAALPILPDSESAAAGGRSAAILALA